jgi:hypothetical protein
MNMQMLCWLLNDLSQTNYNVHLIVYIFCGTLKNSYYFYSCLKRENAAILYMIWVPGCRNFASFKEMRGYLIKFL